MLQKLSQDKLKIDKLEFSHGKLSGYFVRKDVICIIHKFGYFLLRMLFLYNISFCTTNFFLNSFSRFSKKKNFKNFQVFL